MSSLGFFLLAYCHIKSFFDLYTFQVSTRLEDMQYINFSDLPKCDQDWDQMPEIEGGRLCEECNTKMFDFSKMTNLEIIKLHAETEGRVCGHYSPSQLAYPLQEKAELDAPSFFAKAMIGLSTFATTFFANPTTSVAQVPVETVEQNPKRKATKRIVNPIGQAVDSIVLKGQIVDDKAQPLPYASVYVKETEWGVSADELGEFTLVLNKEDVCQKDSFTLVYFFLGFKSVEREIACATFEQKDTWLGEQVLDVDVEILVRTSTVTTSFRTYSRPEGERQTDKVYVQSAKKKWWKGIFRRIFRKRK